MNSSIKPKFFNGPFNIKPDKFIPIHLPTKKIIKNDSTKNESTKNESTKNESTKNESTKNESSKNDSIKIIPWQIYLPKSNKLFKFESSTTFAQKDKKN